MSLSSLRYLLATSSCRPPAQLTEYNDMEDYPRETWEWVWASIANVPHLLFLFFSYFSPTCPHPSRWNTSFRWTSSSRLCRRKVVDPIRRKKNKEYHFPTDPLLPILFHYIRCVVVYQIAKYIRRRNTTFLRNPTSVSQPTLSPPPTQKNKKTNTFTFGKIGPVKLTVHQNGGK